MSEVESNYTYIYSLMNERLGNTNLSDTVIFLCVNILIAKPDHRNRPG